MKMRKMDKAGRVGIPKEVLNYVKFPPRAAVEIFIEGNDKIFLQLHSQCCRLCGEMGCVEGIQLCENCLPKVKSEIKDI